MGQDKRDRSRSAVAAGIQRASVDRITGSSEAPVSVVGIGASAGGLEAIQELLSRLPDNTGLAFVIIQHLSPDYKSMLSEILCKYTMMPVMQAEDGQLIERNTVYLIPPKYNMEVRDGVLVLHEFEHTRVINHPIDVFLRSLAQEYGPHAAAVILSGTGSDGTNGISAIKETGGVIMVQDPATAKFDGMPRSALRTGFADLSMAPAQIASELTHFAVTLASGTIGMSNEELLNKIYSILKKVSGVNYTYYKKSTVTRRIERRMVVNHIDDLYDYVNYLNTSNDEAALLAKDMLIGVTSFFRDPECFEALKEKVIRPLVAEHDEGSEIRVWVPGCSTGEEAYSIAILFAESMEELGVHRKVKIFATDLDQEAVLTAGKGQYGDNILEDVSAQRLGKYFSRRNNTYLVSQPLRRMVVFARQNVFQDPPFGKLDLVSCRNMMIYFQSVLQRDLFAIFHMALKNGAYLFLGKSEAVSGCGDLFMPVAANDKIFLHNANAPEPPGFEIRRQVPSLDGDLMVQQPIFAHEQEDEEKVNTLGIDLQVLEELMPPTLLVDEDNTIRHMFGDCNDYLRFSAGKASFGLFSTLISDLRIAVSTALKTCRDEKRLVTSDRVPVRLHSSVEYVMLQVRPVPGHRGEGSGYHAISFIHEGTHPVPAGAVTYEVNAAASQRITDLEGDLAQSQGQLKKTVGELETVNEELQATNEELLTANEELQSSNEELQSVNEELYTVNAEYQEKLGEVTSLNDDISNFMSSTMVGIIFLDDQLQIRRFTNYVSHEFSVMEQDIGRPIRFMAYNFTNVDLMQICHQVLSTMMPIETDALSVAGKYYFMRVSPYRAEGKRIEGVIITLIDTTSLDPKMREIGTMKRELIAETQSNREKSRFLSTVSHDIRTPLNAIMGVTQLMAVDGDMSEQDLENLQVIEDNVDYLIGIFDGILETSRMHSDRIVIRNELTDGVSFVNSVVSLMRSEATKKDITLTSEVSGDTQDKILVDVNHVRQILVNLIDNAIKYTDHGGRVDISTTMKRIRDDTMRHTYVVTDNGRGMSIDYQRHIFEPFEREYHDSKSAPRGMGLGLYIVKRLVDAMGGAISFESHLGVGTTFQVTIEYKLADEVTDRLDAESKDSEGRDAFLAGKHVLVVEDQSINVVIVCKMLERIGMICDEVANGREAVTTFADSPVGLYDAILMDVYMPIMDGREATVAIRALSRSDAQTVPIFAMTADANEEDFDDFAHIGINDKILKPIILTELYDKLYQAIRHREKGADAGEPEGESPAGKGTADAGEPEGT